MIHWELHHNGEKTDHPTGGFSSFEEQDYLLPLINPGRSYIDPYGDTRFDTEDCKRIIGNIDYMLEVGLLHHKEVIQYDSLEKGLVSLATVDIKNTLNGLEAICQQAVKMEGEVVFFGD